MVIRAVVADDSILTRLYLSNTLKAFGCQVVAAVGDGKEAVEASEKHEPDLLLLDLVMPVMNGCEALLEVKRAQPDIKVVIVSSLDSKKKIHECQERGADYFLLKPFEEAELSGVIDRFFPDREKTPLE